MSKRRLSLERAVQSAYLREASRLARHHARLNSPARVFCDEIHGFILGVDFLHALWILLALNTGK